MEDIIEHFAQRLEISPDMTRQGISITSKFFLQNSEPVVATGLLSMLPSSLTNMFSHDEKQEFKTSQKNISHDEIIKKYLMNVVMAIYKKQKRYTKKQ